MKPLVLIGIIALACGCDDGGPGGTVADMGDATLITDGTVDAGGPCATSAECGGRICIEGACLDCVQTSECAGHPTGDSCVDGACCAAGSEGCACGDGCGDGLDCEAGRCVPETVCPEGTAGCPCGAGCGDDLGCDADVCVDCPAGTIGCACGEGCGDDAICEDDVCLSVVPVVCADLDCADDGRVCDDSGRDAVCGECDLAAGFVDDGAGGCEMLNACTSDAECDAGLRCLQIQADGPRSCSEPPACTILEPAAGDLGASWSPRDGACVPCGACAGEGVTGSLWPTTTARGECVCETTDGWFFDTALDTGAQRICDSDGDQWVQLTARRFVESDDVVLSENARCTVTIIDTVVLQNERGEMLTLTPDDLPWGGQPQPLYEAPITDLGQVGEEVIAPWGENTPLPGQLNPLTKICSDALADFNGNGFSDVQEYGEAEVGANNAWARPYFPLAHFIELHTMSIDGSTLTIAERPRCADGFPFEYATPSDHWQECERRRPADYDPEVPGFDFGGYACDGDGLCDGLSTAELAPGGVTPAQTCSGGPTDRFTGMLHHSQFQCVSVTASAVDAALPNERGFDDPKTQFRTCGLAEDGSPACAAPVEVPSFAWALADGFSASGDAYVRGCQAECDTALPICPGFPAAGCTDRSFGAAECNDCANSGNACETGLAGQCNVGVFYCVGDAEEVCGLSADSAAKLGRAPAEGDPLDVSPIEADNPVLSTPDAFGGEDANCDGFVGQLSTAIFVDQGYAPAALPGLPAPVLNGTPDQPFNTVAAALVAAGERHDPEDPDNPTWTIYVKGDEDAAAEGTLTVPANVGAIRRAVSEGCDAMLDWCPEPGDAQTTIRVDAPVGMLLDGRGQALALDHLRIEITDVVRRDANGNGQTTIGLRSDLRSVTLTRTTIEVPAGTPGADADVDQSPARAGDPGALGSAGCEISAVGACSNECPRNYWTSGQGGACRCGGGQACAGGDGGVGGVPANACQGGINDEDPQPGLPGDPVAGVPNGGAAGMEACAGDELPANMVGGDGENGATGEAVDGVMAAGFLTPEGWFGFSGAGGTRAGNGTGGGGGGGGLGRGTGNLVCPRRGGHGAGGGAGGCGGVGGPGGGAGGASFGVFITGARLTLQAGSAITVGDGGAGGDGAPGELGGSGGLGGRAGMTRLGHGYNELMGEATYGARGGDGGDGGQGGPGNGGAGGPSAAVVLLNGANLDDQGAAIACGDSGPGGLGGENAPAGGGAALTGAPGVRPEADDDCVIEEAGGGVFCNQTADCSGALRCVNSACVARAANGEDCSEDADCTSSYCDDETCAARVGQGAACDDDQGCLTGLCANRVCEDACVGDLECGARAWCGGGDDARRYCIPRLADGADCELRQSCLSNYCDRTCTAPCDRGADCANGSWCDTNRCEPRRPVGEDCDVNAACQDGLYCRAGSCQAKLANGEGCAVRGGDEACESGICNTICVACENNAQCPNGRYCSLGGVNQCEPIRSEGGACTNGEDDGCSGALICDQGECRAPCDDDNDCQGRAFCDDDEGVGCFCRADRACKRGLDIGQACAGDRICRDEDECVGNVCRDCERLGNGSSPGCQNGQVCDQRTCVNPTADGRACDRDDECLRGSQCVNDVCRRECDDSGDCVAGQYCRTPAIGVDRCEPELARGENCQEADACAGDLLCAGGQCSDCSDDDDCGNDEWCDAGNPNVCRDKRETGENCGRPAQCLYGQCSFGVCRDCANDADCEDHPNGPVCRRQGSPNRCIGFPLGSPCTNDRQCGASADCSTLSVPQGAPGRCSFCDNDNDCPDESTCQDTGAGFDSCQR